MVGSRGLTFNASRGGLVMDKSSSAPRVAMGLLAGSVRAALITLQLASALLLLLFIFGFSSSISGVLAGEGGGLSVKSEFDPSSGDVLIRASGVMQNPGVLPASITLSAEILGPGGEALASDSVTKRLGPLESSDFTLTLRLQSSEAAILLGCAACRVEDLPFRLGFEYRSILPWVGIEVTGRGGAGR